MYIQDASAAQFEKSLSVFKQRDFLQSSFEGEKMKNNGWAVRYLLVYEKETLYACAVAAIGRVMKLYTYAYIPRGILFTEEGLQHKEEVVSQIHQTLKTENKCIYVITDPKFILQERDKNGDIVEGGINNQAVVDEMTAMGYQHLPLTKGYDDSHQARWQSVLTLKGQDRDSLFHAFSKRTRQNIKNTLKYHIKVRKLERNELHLLAEMVELSAQKQHFDTLPLSYYEQQYDCFGDHAQAYYTYLDIDNYAQQIQSQLEEEEKTIQEAKEALAQNPHSKNANSRLKVASSHITALEKRRQDAQDLHETYGHEVGLAAAMFIFYGDEVVYLMSGANEDLRRFHGPYALQWYIIQKALEEGYDYYNFYGISGYFEPDQEGYGVFDFKRGFNAHVVELIGVFEYPLRPKLYSLYKKKAS